MKRWLRLHCGIITSFLEKYPEINGIKSSATPEIKSLVHYTLPVIRVINISNPGIFWMDTSTRAKQSKQDPKYGKAEVHISAFSVQYTFSLCDFCIHLWHPRRDGLGKIPKISLLEWLQPTVGSHCTEGLSRNSRFLLWIYCYSCLTPVNDTSCCVMGIHSLLFLGLLQRANQALLNN